MAQPPTQHVEVDARAMIDAAWVFEPRQIGCAWLILLQFYEHAREFTFWDHPNARQMLLGLSEDDWASERDLIRECFEALKERSQVTVRHGRRVIPAAVRQAVYDRDGGICCYCSEPVAYAVYHCDHVEPRSRGGGDEAGNLVTSCAPCNLAKAARTLDDWRGAR